MPSGGGGRGGPDNPPCNTLFVANLGDHATETEVEQHFSQFAGYRQSKIMRTARAVTAFIEFADIPSATHVHATQQVIFFWGGGGGGGMCAVITTTWCTSTSIQTPHTNTTHKHRMHCCLHPIGVACASNSLKTPLVVNVMWLAT